MRLRIALPVATIAVLVVSTSCTKIPGDAGFALSTSTAAAVTPTSSQTSEPPSRTLDSSSRTDSSSSRDSSSVVSSGPTSAASDTLKTNLGDIGDASNYLSQTEQKWRESVAGLSTDEAAVASDARCYFVVDSSRIFTSAIACGPIRRADGSDRHVWDLYATEVQGSSTTDSFASTPDSGPSLAEATPGATGSERPAGELYHPDGQQPTADADALAAPVKPAADAGLLGTLDLSGLPTTAAVAVDPAKNSLISPAGTIQVTQVAQLSMVSGNVVDIITGKPMDSSKSYVPSAGRHFAVFTIATTPGWPKPDTAVLELGAKPPDGSVTFVDGQTKTDISDKVGLTGISSSRTVSFVASVADGSSPTISLGVAGHTQQLSLGSATRVPDPLAAAYYRLNRQSAVNASSPTFTKKYGTYGAQFSYSATVSTVTFTPYDQGKGWAQAGNVWIELAVKDSATSTFGDRVTTDYSKWILTADGKNYRSVANSLDGGNTSGAVTFAVPAATKTVTGSLVTRAVVDPNDTGTANLTYLTPPAVFTATIS